VRSPEFSRRRSLFVKLLVHRAVSGCDIRTARAPTNRLENGEQKLEWFRAREGRALPFHRSNSATARRQWASSSKIVADSIRIEHLRGNELPANVAKTVTKSDFEANIDSETVRERQRPAGFLHDGPW